MLEEGQTIILPAGKLSVRDREILAGIGPGTYRTYPVRSGETIEDIISKRSVRRDEVDKLNKDINLDSLAGRLACSSGHTGLPCSAAGKCQPCAVCNSCTALPKRCCSCIESWVAWQLAISKDKTDMPLSLAHPCLLTRAALVPSRAFHALTYDNQDGGRTPCYGAPHTGPGCG